MAREHKAAPADPAAADPGEVAGGLSTADLRLAPGFVHAISPEHGEPITIEPGELMPDWMRDELNSGGSLAIEGPGVFALVPKGKS